MRGADRPTSKSQPPQAKAPPDRDFARACHDGLDAIVRHTAAFFAFAAALSLTNCKGFVRKMWRRTMRAGIVASRWRAIRLAEVITGARVRFGNAMRAVSLIAALLVSGCISSTGNPERLIPVAVEMSALAADQSVQMSAYDEAVRNNPAAARNIRNEIITRRMYAIDVQYTQYENALTREGQEIGFGALTAATGLSTAATLVIPAATKTILSAAATGVLATKGHYDSEVLLAQTVRTIQKQMRSSRNSIATSISGKMAQNVTDYPLWAALSDVEDYYNAGTLTTGVVDVSTTVGIQETATKERKQDVTQAPLAARPSMILRDTTTPIPAPIVIRGSNPEGVGVFEKSLKPAEIKELQRVVGVCPRTGRFSPDLRNRVIDALGNVKDKTLSDRITINDFDFMREKFRALRGQPDSCPPT